MLKKRRLLILLLIIALTASTLFAAKKKQKVKKKKYTISKKVKINWPKISKKVKINWPKAKEGESRAPNNWLEKVKLPKVGGIEFGARLSAIGGGVSNIGVAMLYGINAQTQAELAYYPLVSGYNISVAGLYTFNGGPKINYYGGGGLSYSTVYGLGGIRYIYDPKITLVGEVHLSVAGRYTIVLGVNYAL